MATIVPVLWLVFVLMASLQVGQVGPGKSVTFRLPLPRLASILSAAEGLLPGARWMGIYGSVVIHPVGGRPPGRNRLELVARDIVRAFERAALLAPGTADATPASPETRVVGHEDL